MKTKRALFGVLVTALLVSVLLISLKAYYVAIALVLGTLILGHREFLSLITKRKMPPIDERVRESASKSVRNAFIFLLSSIAFLMLPFSTKLVEGPETVHVLGGLFVAGGIAYLISYLFYERVEPRLDEKWLKRQKVFLLVAGISFAVFVISVFLHNAIYGLFIHWLGPDFWDRIGLSDEPVFFILSLLSVVALVVGLIGSLVIFIKGLLSKITP